MMKTSIIILISITLIMLLACAPKPTQELKVTMPEPIKSEAKADWEVEWQKTLALAKKEGRVNILGGTVMAPVWLDAWVKNFREKFGIEIELTSGRSAEITAKFLTERRAGLNTSDLFLSGLTTLYMVLKPAGVFERFDDKLILPEVLDSKGWYNERLPWFTKEYDIFSFKKYVNQNFSINTQHIRPGEITSYWDILKPQWKERKFVLNDPTTPGPGSKWFEVYVLDSMLGKDYMKALVKQEPILIRDVRLGAEWVAKGKYPFSIAIPDTHYEPFVSAGAPVSMLEMKEPPYVSSGGGNIAYIKGAPHPAAAKIFLNWLLSKEGQKLTQKSDGNASSRDDIGFEGVNIGVIRKKGVQYFETDNEEYYKTLPQLKELAKDIFSPLTK